LRAALSEILKWVDENVQPANSLMGVRPKASSAAKSGGGASGEPFDAQSDLGETDEGPPTLNLENASGAAVTGAPHSV
jgi:hypothetical protein